MNLRHSSYRQKALARTCVETLECRILLTPALSSLLGANHTIYLDFDGHTTEETDFNSWYNGGQPIISPAVGYSEATITRIWQRVAEDFIPFSVNVTTIDPGIEALRKSGVGDAQWGVRAVVTTSQAWLQDNVGYAVGGVAYVNSFNWSSDTPAFVFNTSELACAETISHEVGHSLGLSHSGTGDVSSTGQLTNYKPYFYGDKGVAPIMGAGWGQPISRWTKGEYPRAYTTQDQLQIITTQNGFGYRVEENDVQQLIPGSPVSGAIETNDDSDSVWFEVSVTSKAVFNFTKALGTNLTEHLRLFRNGGDRVSITSYDALEPDIYYMMIDGVAGGYYSDYGSLGQYTIDVTLTPIDPAPVIDDWGTGTLPIWSWTNPGPEPSADGSMSGALEPYWDDCIEHHHGKEKKHDHLSHSRDASVVWDGSNKKSVEAILDALLSGKLTHQK